MTLLTEFNCDPNIKGWKGRSLLHNACQGGNVSLVKSLLLKYKADINDDNDAPIHVAALSGKEEVVMTLITEFNCNPNIKGRLSRSLLHNACQGGNVSLVRSLLLKYKADVNARDDGNNTPINVAALSGKEEVVMTLLTECNCDLQDRGWARSALIHCIMPAKECTWLHCYWSHGLF